MRIEFLSSNILFTNMSTLSSLQYIIHFLFFYLLVSFPTSSVCFSLFHNLSPTLPIYIPISFSISFSLYIYIYIPTSLSLGMYRKRETEVYI